MSDLIGKKLNGREADARVVLLDSDIDGEYYVVRDREKDGERELTAVRFSLIPKSVTDDAER